MMQSFDRRSVASACFALLCGAVLMQLSFAASMQGSLVTRSDRFPLRGRKDFIEFLCTTRLSIRGGGKDAQEGGKGPEKKNSPQKSMEKAPLAKAKIEGTETVGKADIVSDINAANSKAETNSSVKSIPAVLTLDDYRAKKQPLRLAVTNLTLREKAEEGGDEGASSNDPGTALKAKQVRNVENLQWWGGALKDKENERRAYKKPVHGEEYAVTPMQEISGLQVKDPNSPANTRGTSYRSVLEDDGEGGRVREQVVSLLTHGQELGSQTAGAHTMVVPHKPTLPVGGFRGGNFTDRGRGGYHTGRGRGGFDAKNRYNGTRYQQGRGSNAYRGGYHGGRGGSGGAYFGHNDTADGRQFGTDRRHGNWSNPYNRAPRPPGQGYGTNGSRAGGGNRQWRGDGGNRGRGAYRGTANNDIGGLNATGRAQMSQQGGQGYGRGGGGYYNRTGGGYYNRTGGGYYNRTGYSNRGGYNRGGYNRGGYARGGYSGRGRGDGAMRGHGPGPSASEGSAAAAAAAAQGAGAGWREEDFPALPSWGDAAEPVAVQ